MDSVCTACCITNWRPQQRQGHGPTCMMQAKGEHGEALALPAAADKHIVQHA
jgi:hypothetical protein